MTDLAAVRSQFPALQIQDDGLHRLYLDNPAGTQVPERVLDAIRHYLIHHNANAHGAFRTSRLSDAAIQDAHEAMADLLNARDSREIIFGPNMTTLTFSLSRALARQIRPGQEILLTRLDHDANISPWVRMAEDTGAVVRWLDFDPADCTLRLDELDRLLSDNTFLVAVGYASNLVGTVNPVRQIIAKTHAVGALAFVDAVHYVPHGPVDVQEINADFLVCSPYKFFGPHQGVLWGRAELLAGLPAYRVRPAGAQLPGKFETGTQNHECMAGTLAALDYLASLAAANDSDPVAPALNERRHRLKSAMERVNRYEQTLSQRLIEGLGEIPGLKIHGITEPSRLDQRVPTISFTLEGHSPRAIAEQLATKNIFVWDGHSYAVEVVKRLGLEETGGVIRAGAVHYNTPAELDRFISAVQSLT